MPFRILSTQADNTVADIDERCWLTIIGCDRCGPERAVTFTGPELVARFPLEATIGQIAERLVCSTCGGKDGGIGFIQEHSRRAGKRTTRKRPGVPNVYGRK
jgi:hypothetical protein